MVVGLTLNLLTVSDSGRWREWSGGVSLSSEACSHYMIANKEPGCLFSRGHWFIGVPYSPPLLSDPCGLQRRWPRCWNLSMLLISPIGHQHHKLTNVKTITWNEKGIPGVRGRSMASMAFSSFIPEDMDVSIHWVHEFPVSRSIWRYITDRSGVVAPPRWRTKELPFLVPFYVYDYERHGFIYPLHIYISPFSQFKTAHDHVSIKHQTWAAVWEPDQWRMRWSMSGPLEMVWWIKSWQSGMKLKKCLEEKCPVLSQWLTFVLC